MRSVAFIFFLLTSFGVYAQESEEKQDTTEVKSVQLTDITTSLETEYATIRRLESELENQTVRLLVDSLTPIYKEEFESVHSNIESGNYLNTSTLEQTQMLREVDQFISSIDELNESLRERLTTLNEANEDVESSAEKWRRTRDEIEDSNIRERIVSLILRLIDLKTNIQGRLSSVLETQQELADVKIQMQTDKELLETALEDTEKKLFVRNKGFLWTELSDASDTVGFVGTITHGFDVHYRSGRNFIPEHKSAFIFHLFLLFVSIYIFISLKKQSESIEEKLPDNQRSSLRILNNPIAAALVPPLVITYWLYQEAPTIVYHIAFLLTIIPLFVLVFKNLEKVLKTIVILLIVAQLSESLYINVSSDSPFFRIMLLINSALIASTYFLTARRMRLQHSLDKKRASSVFLIAARVGFIATVAGVLFNIIGYESLASYIIRAAITVATLGLLVFVSVLILRSMLVLTVYSSYGQQINFVKEFPKQTITKISRAIQFFAILLWLELSLTFVKAFYDIRQGLVDFWNLSLSVGPATDGVPGLTVGSLLTFFFIIYLSIVISRFLRLIFDTEIQQRYQINQDITSTVSILIRYSLISVGFFVAVIASGFSLDRLAILIGALGVGIGFGLQNIINNLISGLILAFERPVKVGDIIEVSTLNLIGTVKEIGIRASIIRTFDETEVIVPNGNIISNEVVNWTLSDKVRRNTVEVGVEYGSNTEQVIEILIQQAKTHTHVMDRPEPFALFVGFGDSSLNFKLFFWTANYDRRLVTLSEIHVSIDKALKDAGITIPFPQRDLHIKTVEDQASGALKNGPEPATPEIKKSSKKGSDNKED